MLACTPASAGHFLLGARTPSQLYRAVHTVTNRTGIAVRYRCYAGAIVRRYMLHSYSCAQRS